MDSALSILPGVNGARPTVDVRINILCYNEMLVLPYTLKFYKMRFPDAIVTIFDNMSTDGSKEYALEQGCVVESFDTNESIDDYKYLYFKNEYWKTQRTGKPQWVITIDCDEWLDATVSDLIQEKASILNTIEYVVCGPEKVVDDSILDLRNGFKNPHSSKRVCFRSDLIESINYNCGAHFCNPVAQSGEVELSEKLYILRHLHFFSLETTIKKHLSSSKRNAAMKAQGNATHYIDNEAGIIAHYNGHKDKCVPF